MTSSATLYQKIPVQGWLVNGQFIAGATPPEGASWTSATPLVSSRDYPTTRHGYMLSAALAVASSYKEALEAIALGQCAAATKARQALQHRDKDLVAEVLSVEALTKDAARKEASAQFLEERQEQRWSAMWHWAHSRLSETQKTEFFNIAANGSPNASESPVTPAILAELTALRAQNTQLTADLALANQLLRSNSATL